MSDKELPSLRFRLDPSRLGAMLRTIRQAAGLTQAEVAEKLGTTQSAIARLESDTAGRISLRRFARFCTACGFAPLRPEVVTRDAPYTPPQTYVSPSAFTAQPAKPTTGPGPLPPMAS